MGTIFKAMPHILIHHQRLEINILSIELQQEKFVYTKYIQKIHIERESHTNSKHEIHSTKDRTRSLAMELLSFVRALVVIILYEWL